MAFRMRDVAQRVGVSVTTVSHVVNNTRHVAPETRQRVLEVIRQLDFYKNVHAQRLARGTSDFFGLIISDIENPFFPALIKGFETCAVQRGFDLLLCATNYDPGRTQAAVREMIENKVRGVAVMTSQAGAEVAEALTSHQVPVVFFDLGPVLPYRSNIRVDYAHGIGEAIAYLQGLGHREFALIAGSSGRRSTAVYQGAFAKAVNQWGLAPNRIVEGNQKVDGGVAAVRTLLAGPNFPTAILCHNDLTAIGAITTLQEAGVRVPEDVSVVGADDIYFASLIRPPLTTINLQRQYLGRLAFEALEKMLHYKRRRGAEYVVETHMVVRKLTAHARDWPLKLPESFSDVPREGSSSEESTNFPQNGDPFEPERSNVSTREGTFSKQN